MTSNPTNAGWAALGGFQPWIDPWLMALMAAIAIGLLIHNHWLKARLRRQVEQLQEREQRLRLLTDNMTDFVWVVDAQSRLSYVSPSVTKLLGYTPDEMMGQAMTYALEPESAEFTLQLQQKLVAAAKRGEHRNYVDTVAELAQRHKRGHRIWTEVAIRVFFTPEGDFAGAQGSGRNINERKKAEQTVWEMAFYDPLTDLPNRRLMNDRLTQALANASRQREQCAVFFLDLDNFKQINDTEGHDGGDQLLVAVADRLREHLRDSDTIARYGGDEFVVVSQFLGREPAIARASTAALGEKILALFRTPFEINGRAYTVYTSVGAALSRQGEHPVSELLREADLAMYQAKTQGRNQLVIAD